jgi:hypothetical protein
MLARQAPGLEYFFGTQSFSEVANAKAAFEALAKRWLTELRERRYAARLLTWSDKSPKRHPSDECQVACAIHDLGRGIDEFQGTDHELAFVQDLLILLKSQGLYDRWLDLYFRLLYQHPTEDLVSVLAPDALAIACTADREQEMLNAFKHVTENPLVFGAKGQIAALSKGDHKELASKPRRCFLADVARAEIFATFGCFFLSKE